MLDLSPVTGGSSAHDALHRSLDLAELTDSLGFTRTWFAEHHNAAAIASSAPEIVIGLAAARTRQMRIGAGGIMLPNHSPLKVAELFRVLAALFPGRIDLALGRAAGTDPATARELRRGKPMLDADELPAELDKLSAYLKPDDGPRSPFARSTIAVPTGEPRPRMWLLGSSDYSSTAAAERGLGFAFAHHMNPADARQELTKYRDLYRATESAPSPYAIVSVAVICAETDDDAKRLSASAELGWIRFAQGMRDEPMPSVEEALAHQDDDQQAAIRAMFRDRLIIGSPARVRARLQVIKDECAADEIMVLTHVHDHEARRRSYALLAEAFDLAR